jgi:hypothetical protein
MASKTVNPNGLAIVETLLAHKGETLAFAEIANLAKVDAKTGYLTSAKKLATERNMTLQKVINGVKATIKTVTEFPHGLKVEGEKEVVLDGYRLVDGKDSAKEIELA